MPPLLGVVAEEGVPPTALPQGHLRLVFRWAYDDALFAAKGEGVARVAAPDSVRLDFFVDAGLGAGEAILIGDRLETANEDARRYLPPVPLLWAALGVLTVTGPDTAVRRQGDTLRVQVGAGYRATVVARQLVELGRMEGGRWRERVRRDSATVEYRHFTGRRRLTLSSIRRIPEGPFDAAIWHR